MLERFLLTTAVVLTGWAPADPSAIAQEGLFRQRIGPLLESRCLACHLSDDGESGIGLTTRESLVSHALIVPGEPDSSRLVEVVTPHEGRAEMPQGAAPLSAADVAALREWISQGAVWPADMVLEAGPVRDYSGWAFQPLQLPAIPQLDDEVFENPIDAFVRAKLAPAGLQPSPRADRRTLIRRLTFDLTGLPPTTEAVQAFVADEDPQAYEKLVERLLASPRYGEHWARHWLDVVKYADTCGYDKDKLRPHAWPYRDYVIRSLNEDKPYGRFVQEQVAGDVLFPGDPDGILGLGMIAAGPWDFIGHVEVPESKIDGKVARNLDRDDMVSNVFNTFCSLTVQCARCHHHKFDPISQTDYYQLQAIFAAVDRAEREFDADPEVARTRKEWSHRRNAAQQGLAQLNQEILAAGGPRLQTLEAQLKELGDGKSIQGLAFGYHSQVASVAATTKWVGLEFSEPTIVSRLVLHPCFDDFNQIGAGFGFPVRFRIETQDDQGQWHVVHDLTDEDYPNPGLSSPSWELPTEAIRGVRLLATQLAPRQNDFHLALAELEAMSASGQNVAGDAKVIALDTIEAPPRWRRDNLVDGKYPSPPRSPEGLSREKLEAARAALLQELDTPERVARRKQLEAELQEAAEVLAELPEPQRVYAAATEFKAQGNFQPTGGKPRPIHLLARGEVSNPGRLLGPALLPLAPGETMSLSADLDEGHRRAALARWLTDREHPLVWRSIVNRVWQYHFGEGLVATPNDFGKMGAAPTHPELLDWLAVRFRDSGQSLKELHRWIVTSQTYQQSSAHHAGNEARDASNRLLWRMSRRRLTAEEMRDAILAVSGRLDFSMGGPGYYLFQIEKPEHSPHFEYHQFDPADPSSHRRSIYRFVVRSQPDPWMTTLDCADSSQSTPRRNETLTPLQALSLMNSRFNLVMAESMAAELAAEAGDARQQVQLAWQRAFQRSPTPEELTSMEELVGKHGLVQFCRLMFNLNEFAFVD